MRITCIAGLPGSGKTTLARQIAGPDSTICDDPRDLASIAKCKCDHLYIIDSHFCLEESRGNAVAVLGRLFPGAEVEFWFFRNDPGRCLENARRRNDGREVHGFIAFLSKNYRIPRGSKTIPVWSG